MNARRDMLTVLIAGALVTDGLAKAAGLLPAEVELPWLAWMPAGLVRWLPILGVAELLVAIGLLVSVAVGAPARGFLWFGLVLAAAGGGYLASVSPVDLLLDGMLPLLAAAALGRGPVRRSANIWRTRVRRLRGGTPHPFRHHPRLA